MNHFWLSLGTGLVAGGVDVIPMLLKKFPKARVFLLLFNMSSLRL